MKNTILIIVTFFFIVFSTKAQNAMDDKIKALTNEIADQILAKGGTKVAVTTIAYKNCVSTEFGKYLAEELTGYLSTSGRKITVVNQELLEKLLEQNKLTAKGLLEAKNDAAKLGQVSGINALVYGSIITFGEDLKISLNVVKLPTLEVTGFAKSSFSLTNGITDKLKCTSEASITPPTSPQLSKDCKEKQYCMVCVMNQSNQDITTFFFDPNREYKQLLINPNQKECWKEVYITDGKDFETKRWYVEIETKRVKSEVFNVEACKTYEKIFKN